MVLDPSLPCILNSLLLAASPSQVSPSTLNPNNSKRLTASHSTGYSWVPVTVVHGNCTYGNWKELKSPFTIKTNMELARGTESTPVWLPRLLSYSERSVLISPRSVNPIRLSRVKKEYVCNIAHRSQNSVIIPVCLSKTKFSLIRISSISRRTHFSLSTQESIFAVSASNLSTDAEKPR